MGRKSNITRDLCRTVILTACLLVSQSAATQYFGRNKPGYKQFDFRVTRTPNFEIYHYLENDSLRNDLAASAELWYKRHQAILKDTFTRRNPLILYNDHADFQQTNAVSGMIGVGTGGVTEGLKNRVVMPVAHTLAQTDHVLGHELVHAFQFHMLTQSDSLDLSLRNLPLWMVEGMAEYLSIGSVDPHTSMWMRDALINKDFPTLEDLNKESRYFPYRYGQAFWATIGKTWGDSVIAPLFLKTAQVGYDKALDSILGINEETFSGMWKSAMQVHFEKFMKDSVDRMAGEPVIMQENAGRINISPAMSPDGRYMAFISEKDIFTLDLYLYDIRAGKIVRKLTSTVRQNEIDDFNFIESAGSWSPDGSCFAFVVFSSGKNKLVILDVRKGRITEEIELNPLVSFTHPAWSPDGRQIVVSGLQQGISDLYLFDLESRQLEKLTDDYTSNIHPAWSPDGRYITYSAERINPAGQGRPYTFDIAVYELASGKTNFLNVFPGADNLNPVFSPTNRSIFFLSDRDGLRNLYGFDLNSGKAYQLTDYLTGISGITAYSPAISMAPGSGKMVYTYYSDHAYRIYLADTSEFEPVEVDPAMVNMEAGTLPPLEHVSLNLVDRGLYNPPAPSGGDGVPTREVPYRPKFKLDYISNVGAGFSTNRYGTGMAGSVNMLFSDILGDNQLFAAVAANGEIWDFGGQVAYVNTKHRINWGAAVSHIPYLSGYSGYKRDSLKIQGEMYQVHNYTLDLVRMFEDNISVFSFFPVSTTRRIEAGLSLSRYNYRVDRYNNYYSDNLYRLGVKKEKMPAPDGFNLQKADVAYVVDNSHFGMTAPMRGYRSRLQVERYFGDLGFFTGLADYRRYFYRKPVNLSFRLYHYGRYGKDVSKGIFSPLFIGYPWLVRGYESSSFFEASADDALDIDQLIGSKIMVGNAELRFPLSGPERLALIKSRFFMADLNLFFDAGVAWDSAILPQPADTPVFSAGTSLRVNVLGYVVLEPFYAIPFQNGGWKNGVFGFNFSPGW